MRLIKLDENNKIVQINEGSGVKMIEGFLESDTGEFGQIMLHDGTFIDDVVGNAFALKQTQLEQIEI
jgi:hypothetical protein